MKTEIRKQIGDMLIFGEMFDRFLEHLAANEIDIDEKTVTLGPWLQIDGPNEQFKDNDQANLLVRGFYREPYTIPDLSV